MWSLFRGGTPTRAGEGTRSSTRSSTPPTPVAGMGESPPVSPQVIRKATAAPVAVAPRITEPPKPVPLVAEAPQLPPQYQLPRLMAGPVPEPPSGIFEGEEEGEEVEEVEEAADVQRRLTTPLSEGSEDDPHYATAEPTLTSPTPAHHIAEALCDPPVVSEVVDTPSDSPSSPQYPEDGAVEVEEEEEEAVEVQQSDGEQPPEAADEEPGMTLADSPVCPSSSSSSSTLPTVAQYSGVTLDSVPPSPEASRGGKEPRYIFESDVLLLSKARREARPVPHALVSPQPPTAAPLRSGESRSISPKRQTQPTLWDTIEMRVQQRRAAEAARHADIDSITVRSGSGGRELQRAPPGPLPTSRPVSPAALSAAGGGEFHTSTFVSHCSPQRVKTTSSLTKSTTDTPHRTCDICSTCLSSVPAKPIPERSPDRRSRSPPLFSGDLDKPFDEGRSTTHSSTQPASLTPTYPPPAATPARSEKPVWACSPSPLPKDSSRNEDLWGFACLDGDPVPAQGTSWGTPQAHGRGRAAPALPSPPPPPGEEDVQVLEAQIQALVEGRDLRIRALEDQVAQLQAALQSVASQGIMSSTLTQTDIAGTTRQSVGVQCSPPPHEELVDTMLTLSRDSMAGLAQTLFAPPAQTLRPHEVDELEEKCSNLSDLVGHVHKLVQQNGQLAIKCLDSLVDDVDATGRQRHRRQHAVNPDLLAASSTNAQLSAIVHRLATISTQQQRRISQLLLLLNMAP